MKVVLKNIILSLLLGVYLLTTSISRIEVFKLVLCSPKTVTEENSSSKPQKIEQKLWWNFKKQISHSTNIQLPAYEFPVKSVIPSRECISFVAPIYDCNLLTEYYFSDSSPRSPPLA